jgi:hypothetical protein
MDRDEWCDQFSDELKKLRPHVGSKLAWTLALHQFDAKAHPRVAAREYHKRQEPGLPPKRASKRRSP